MKSHRHDMPFGAEVRPDGSVRFRLWAPAAERVELCLGQGPDERVLAMEPLGDGWAGLTTREARPGTLYRFRIDGGRRVPDPASRFQPQDVHGPSEVVDPAGFAWGDAPWPGRPWEEAVFYELHVGTFSPEGTFRGVTERLDYLAGLGVTAVELMPVADFPGRRNWGYDGVLPFAPDAGYGRPEDLKALVRTAHELGLMVFLDVVYNHFGPDGNYLHLYAPGFFTERHHTPWGAGIDFDGESSRTVRDFFVHNALYWLSEYRFDGLRLDAVHAIADASDPHILVELAEAVQAGPGRERHVHLVLENDHNAARYLERRRDGSPRWYAAQWNDDFHHALHLLTTGEGDGYYMDYADHPAHHLGRSLTEGNAYQGEHSAFRDGAPRGEPSAHLPPTAFVDFLQNHDQAGNRAFGERIDALAPPAALRAALTVLLLAPAPPLLFMGQEFMPRSPFLFFCDFGDALAEAVTNGRRREFRRFGRFADPEAQASIPDPNDPDTFRRSGLHWQDLDRESHRDWLTLHRELLALRRREIVPRLRGIRGGAATFRSVGPGGLRVQWRLGDGVRLTLIANLSAHPLAAPGLAAPAQGHLLRAEPGTPDPSRGPEQPPWAAAWYLEPAGNVPGAGRNRHPRAPWSGSA